MVREIIERLVRKLIGLLDPWSAIGRMLLELRVSETRRFRPLFKRLRRHLSLVIADGQREREIDPTLDPSLTAAALITTADGIFLPYLIDPRAFPDTTAISLINPQVEGVDSRPGSVSLESDFISEYVYILK